MNRKGFGADTMFFVCIMFGIAIAGVLAYFFADQMRDAILLDPNIPADAAAVLNTNTDRFDNVFDYAILTIFVAGVIGLMIVSYALRSSPALFFVLMIIIAILGGIAGHLSNAFVETFSGNTPISNALLNFPITDFLMSNYLIVIIVVGFLMLIAFFLNDGAYA